jgi:Glycosyltransferase family 87/WD40-like Beta Propeller Repeat
MALVAVAAIGVLYFLCTSFRAGWMQSETDFPNYYTAARLLHSGEHLRDFYDWTWFQRQMNYAGIERQLGAYTPQPPLTMLPIVPIAGFPVQTAKRIWLVLNLALLAATVWLLSRIGRLRVEHIAILALAGYTSLRMNFLLGQYYVFLLFLLTATFYLIARKKPVASGVAAGLAFALKLYGGPLLLFFMAKRNWKAVAGMAASSAAGVVVAVAIFGPADVWFYATQILPRTLEGVPADPFNPGIPVLVTLLRRLFVGDAELNPHPFYHAPWLFFFFRAFAGLAIIVLVSLAVALNRAAIYRRDFAIFVIALLLLSTSVTSYTFLLLLLPIVLCLEDAPPVERIYLVVSYILLNLPLPAARLFPKYWLLLALLVVAGRRHWSTLSPRIIAGTLAGIAAIAVLNAQLAMADYRSAPAQSNQLAAVEKGSLFCAFPVISRAGLFFQAQTRYRYILRWQHDDKVEDFSFDGQVFHPVAPDPAGPIHFELVAHGGSKMMQFDPATRKTTASTLPLNIHADSVAPSPDGRQIAFTSTRGGSQQIYIKNVATGKVKRLTGGNCNNSEPAWELNSKAVVFASDCGRAVGLSALYRIDVN